MKIIAPNEAKTMTEIEEFRRYSEEYIREELPIYHASICGCHYEDETFHKITIHQSRFLNSNFKSCDFEKSTFIDVIFQSCDFSNSKFSGAYFERCWFDSCKFMGVVMTDTIFKHITMKESNFQYSYLDKTRMSNVMLETVDLTEVSLTEAKIKSFEAKNTKFVKNNFFQTPLKGIDFTNNEFLSPTVSEPPDELKGITINMTQAVELIGRWGIQVSY